MGQSVFRAQTDLDCLWGTEETFPRSPGRAGPRDSAGLLAARWQSYHSSSSRYYRHRLPPSILRPMCTPYTRERLSRPFTFPFTTVLYHRQSAFGIQPQSRASEREGAGQIPIDSSIGVWRDFALTLHDLGFARKPRSRILSGRREFRRPKGPLRNKPVHGRVSRQHKAGAQIDSDSTRLSQKVVGTGGVKVGKRMIPTSRGVKETNLPRPRRKRSGRSSSPSILRRETLGSIQKRRKGTREANGDERCAVLGSEFGALPSSSLHQLRSTPQPCLSTRPS